MRIFTIPFSIIIIDQFAKFLANKNLLPQTGRFFETISCNKGIAFGIEIPTFIFILLWLASITIIFWLIQNEKQNVPLLFVLGGAISNIIDRVLTACVTDYITFMGIPTFNIADTAICLGITFFVIKIFFPTKNN